MKLSTEDRNTKGVLVYIKEEPDFKRLFFRERKNKLLTIAWNTGNSQNVWIDEIKYDFPANSILPLMVNQSFRFEHAKTIIAWQFNRDFYCIVDHDKDVGCVGLLFYGSKDIFFIQLDISEQMKFNSLNHVFEDEFHTRDTIQGEMLRMLLKRLIIKLTRLMKDQYLSELKISNTELDIVRQFNMLVENNYKEQHQVQQYAALLHKSPKTLSNLFAQYNHSSPQQVIQDRITLEAKRLLYYTDKSSKEIANKLGFDEAANFSRFFKTATGISPSDFKETALKQLIGKD